MSDGVEHTAQGAASGALQSALAAAGTLTVARAEQPVRLLPPPVAEADRLRLRVQQVPLAAASEAVVLARTGDGRALARAAVPLPANAASAEAELELPIEIRNQVVRLELEGAPGAGGVLLLDERFRRRPVGLLPGAEDSADTPLIGDLFYLDRALAPYAEMRRGSLDRLLSRPIAVLALADRPVAEGPERDALTALDQRRRHADPLRRPAASPSGPTRCCRCRCAPSGSSAARCPGSSRSASRPSPTARPSPACPSRRR